MESEFKFNGLPMPYRNLRNFDSWGALYVDNTKRSRRVRPLHPGPCPFCGIAIHPKPEMRMNYVHLRESDDEVTYLLIDNINPIVENQVLLFPQPTKNPDGFLDHRIDIEKSDIALLTRLVTNGFVGLECAPIENQPSLINADGCDGLEAPYTRPWAVYVNTFPGTGRSVPHLHLNCIPADYIPRLNVLPSSWQICRDSVNGTIISRLAETRFYALIFEAEDVQTLANTLETFHTKMNKWEIPYNLIAYPPTSGDSSPTYGPRVMVVPRDQEYCEAADQRIAGLEFLTGVLIPGPNRINSMDTIQRDLALAQATLKGQNCLAVERLLRGCFGIPLIGDAVYAAPTDDTQPSESGLDFTPKVRKNQVFDASSLRDAWREDDEDSGGSELRDRAESPLPDRKTKRHKNRHESNVLVRIVRTSICQSDRRVLLGTKPSELKDDPLVLGHEGGGYIVDPGPWDDELQAGQKVVILPHLTCGKCQQCRTYRQNLCRNMKHLGFHLHGNMAQLMSFPYQCILPVPPDFPNDALPLVEPLACILRALFRIKDYLSTLPALVTGADLPTSPITIYGAGPMGCLAARAFKRFWPKIKVKMIEPNDARHAVVRGCKIADEIVTKPPAGEEHCIGFVASSALKASIDAIERSRNGGRIVLFSGINEDDIHNSGEQHPTAVTLEHIHRRELSDIMQDPLGKRIYRIGSSGYNYDDAARSVRELHRYYPRYATIQNVRIDGLASKMAHYKLPGEQERHFEQDKAVEALLAPLGIYDKKYGTEIAETLKVLISL